MYICVRRAVRLFFFLSHMSRNGRIIGTKRARSKRILPRVCGFSWDEILVREMCGIWAGVKLNDGAQGWSDFDSALSRDG